jgi:hypothetical protein
MACYSPTNSCLPPDGCPPGVCPDFQLRRHDTRPELRLDVADCDGPIDLTGLVCEASMWAKGKLKKPLLAADNYLALADNVGFEQASVGDIMVVSRSRAPEQMLVTGFDETNRLIQVQRGYNGSPVGDHRRGTAVRIFRVLNAVAATEMVRESIPQTDGTTLDNVLTRSTLVYEWQPGDTCLAGCFWFEFKVLKMAASMAMGMADGGISAPISFVSYTPSVLGCGIGDGVEWVQRYPTAGEGLLVRIIDSPTAENVTL